MGYVEGFVLAVPTANREAYRKQAAAAVPIFHEFGMQRMVEAWGEDVPDGKVTDFRGAVKATPDETVVFAWLEYESRAARDAANAAMRTDARLRDLGEMPFDAKRMIMSGFESILDHGGGVDPAAGSTTGYVDGYLVAVSNANREAYRAVAAQAAEVFEEFGALRTVEAWGDDVPDGKVTDFPRAVKAEPGESVVFSWVEWPSKELRNAGWKRFMEEGRMSEVEMPFDGKRMIYGGFEPILIA